MATAGFRRLDSHIAAANRTAVCGDQTPTPMNHPRLRRRALCAALLAWANLVSPASAQPINVTVNLDGPATISQFRPGISQIDLHLRTDVGNNPDAVAAARVSFKDVATFANQHFMAWGVNDPWPNPPSSGSLEPTQWATMDAQMNVLAQIDPAMPRVLTLAIAPWWMKGQLQANGTTKLITPEDLEAANGEWAADMYMYRVLDNQMDNWCLLVQRAAEKYMRAPYNVRHFQVWNELKGYFNPGTNNWDMADNPGTPAASPPSAKHGYSYFYRRTVGALQAARDSLAANGVVNIPWSEIKIGGPYMVMDSGNVSGALSHPSSTVNGSWGVLDSRALNGLATWVQATRTANVKRDFIVVDGGNKHKFVSNQNQDQDPFRRAEKLAAVNQAIRNLFTAPDTPIPIWWAETYYTTYNSKTADNGATIPGNAPESNLAANPPVIVQMPDTPEARDAVGAYSNIQQVMSGAATALLWGATHEGRARPALYSNTNVSGGGQETPYYDTLLKFRYDFGAGIACYPVAINDTASSSNPRVGAIGSHWRTLLVNKRMTSQTVALNGQPAVTLAPYQVLMVSTPRPSIGINFRGGTSANGFPAAMAAGEYAGVVPMARWNNASGSTGTLALTNAVGSSSGASASWSAYQTYSTAIADTAGNARMMKGYLTTNNDTSTTVTVTSLPVSITRHGYDVYVYFDTPNGSAVRKGTYTLNTSGVNPTATVVGTDASDTDFSGTFSESTATTAGNYVKFTQLSAASFTLTATPHSASDGVKRAPVNAIQIVARP